MTTRFNDQEIFHTGDELFDVPSIGRPAAVETAAGRLRRLLRANAGFSALTGAIATVDAGPVAELLGVAWPWLVRAGGIGLLIFSGALLLIARRPASFIGRAAPAISVADFGWVIGTVAVIGLGWLPAAGATVLAAVALPVLALGLGQLRAGRLIRSAG